MVETFINFPYTSDDYFDDKILQYITTNYALHKPDSNSNDTKRRYDILQAINTGNTIISFIILDNMTNETYRFVKNRFHKQLTVHIFTDYKTMRYPQSDFWTCYGVYILRQYNICYIEYGYKDIEYYGDLFFNDYGIHHELMDIILKKAIPKIRYIEEKEMWINFDEILLEKNTKIMNIASECSDEDKEFLLFKSIIELEQYKEYNNNYISECVISEYLISYIGPKHFRVFSYDTDIDGNNAVIDYLIDDNNMIIIEHLTTNIIGIPIWNKFIDKML
jgi:hypothetical protein